MLQEFKKTMKSKKMDSNSINFVTSLHSKPDVTNRYLYSSTTHPGSLSKGIYRSLHNAVPQESTIISLGGTGLRKDVFLRQGKIPNSFIQNNT
jgi:hypothetical protein